MRYLVTFVLGLLCSFVPAQDPNYYTVAEIEAAIDGQVALHPTRALKVNLSSLPGGVLTHEGRPIYALKVSDNVAVDEDEPAILIAAQHHARELNSPVMVIGAMERLLAGYGVNAALTSVIDDYEVYFVPMVNPDGVNHVWNVYNFWRKNRRNNGDGTFGVDLNRNFPFLWGNCGSSSSTGSDIYRGPSAASEPEVQVMRNLVATLRPEVYLDIHSSGQEVLRTYAPCATVSAPIAGLIERYVDDLRAPMSYAKRDPSASGEAPEDHWASGGALSFLIEIGTSFQPSYATTLTEEARVWPGIERVLTAWRPALRGHVRSSVGNAPLEATITYTPNTFNHGEVTRSRARDGRYGLWLPLGNWSVTFSAPGHQDYTTAVTVASYDSPVTLDVTLTGGCARYVPDSDPTTGVFANQIPFGTSGGLSTVATTFASNNGGSIGGAVYFDITGVNNVYLHGIDVNTGVGAGTDIIADIYYRYDGTYAGNEADPTYWAAWTAAKGTAEAAGTPSALTFNRGLYIGSGVTVAIAVVARNFDHDYTNGANSYSDANITVDTGSASNAPFTTPVFNPRTANINCNYKVDASPYHNQIYQQVLRSGDLGPAGSITGLAFAPSTGGRHYNRFLRVRMAHVPAGYAMSTTFATNISGYTTVLSENYLSWHTYADTWCEVGLESAFAYNGTDDVVIEIYARGNLQSEGAEGGFWRGTEERLFAHGWAWNAPPSTGTLSNAALKIRADFECAETGEFGTSCGPTHADGYSTPVAGTNYWFDIHDALPNSACFLFMGFNGTRTDLTSFGFTNCVGWNDNVASLLKISNGSGLAYHAVALPNSTAFDGLKIYGYWANLDASQPGGITFTNGVRMIIGQEGFTNPNL